MYVIDFKLYIYVYIIINIVVRSLRRIVELETLYGTPSQHTPTINQLVYYYKQVVNSYYVIIMIRIHIYIISGHTMYS